MELKNRFVVPPMETNFGTYEGFVTDQMIEYCRTRALGGFDTIVLAMGVKPYNPLEEAAKKVCDEV